MHGGRYHIIGVAQACHIRIREIRSQYGIDELLAVRRLVGRHVREIRSCKIHFGIIGIPIESGLSASFWIAIEGRSHGTVRQILVDVDITCRTRQGHTDIAIMIEHRLIGISPFGGGAGSPCTPVGRNPVSMFVIVSFSFFLRTPVDFGNDDGIRFYNRYRLSKFLDERISVGIFVAAIIPSHVSVHGITYIVSFDGIVFVAHVIALPSRPGYPNDTVETIGTYLVYDGLEEVIRGTCAFQAVGIVNVHRFVGQLYGNLPTMFLNIIVARHDVPHFQQIILIVAVHLDTTGTYTGRTYDHVKPMVQSFFYDFPIERGQIRTKPLLAELRDIGLARFLTCDRKVRVIRPTRVQMKSEHIAIGALRRVRNSREELIEILDAVFFGGIVGHVSPPPVVEIRTRGVHHTVQHHFVTVSVRQVFPVHTDGRRHLCAYRSRHQQESGKHNVFHFSHNKSFYELSFQHFLTF